MRNHQQICKVSNDFILFKLRIRTRAPRERHNRIHRNIRTKTGERAEPPTHKPNGTENETTHRNRNSPQGGSRHQPEFPPRREAQSNAKQKCFDFLRTPCTHVSAAMDALPPCGNAFFASDFCNVREDALESAYRIDVDQSL